MMNLKELKKNTLKRTASAVLMLTLGSLIYSCSILECEECDANVPEEIRKIGDGDFAAYKSFMKKHPDPEFNCCVLNSGINAVNLNTQSQVIGSGNFEIIKDFFSYNLSQSTKNDFLHSYWTDTLAEVTEFLIVNDAKLESSNYCDLSFLPGLKSLSKLGYDMNYVDPKSGRNLFLDYSAVGYEKKIFKDGNCAVQCLEYLKSIGVDTKIKDADGKTALEVASDPIIINYLKSI